MTRNAFSWAGPLIALAMAWPAAAGPQQAEPAVAMTLHPGALAELIDEVGGRDVTLVRARVVAVVNPRVILVESASSLPAARGHHDRVLVMARSGELGVAPAVIVGENVVVDGIARTLLGLQVTREVPWPPELNRKVLQRYDIRAGVLASSIRTADGVDLTRREPPVEQGD